MKLITKLYDLDESQTIKYRLEMLGIPIHIGSENSGPAMGAMPAADCYTIWAELDEQYDCALQALSNSDYEPKNPVDVDAYRSSQEEIMVGFRNRFSKVNEYILNTIVIVVIGCFLYFAISNM